MRKYKISEKELNLLIEAINCDEDEYRSAEFDEKTKILDISGDYGCSDIKIQLE